MSGRHSGAPAEGLAPGLPVAVGCRTLARMASSPSPFFDSLNRIGFKRWYERQLMSGHANLVLCLFGLLGVMVVNDQSSSTVGQPALRRRAGPG